MTRFNHSISWLCLIVLCLMAPAGCSEGPRWSGATGTVQGTVTLEGEPVTSGSIFFIGKTIADTASAELQPDGTYSLQYETGFSVPAADYRVSLGASNATGEIPDPAALMDNPDKYKVMMPAVPEKYLSVETSGLIAAVKEGQNNLDFDLKKPK